MGSLHIYRWLRAEHEQRHPHAAPPFVYDCLEIIMSVLDDLTSLHTELAADAQTLETGIAGIKAQIDDLKAAAANADPAVTAAVAQLATDVAAVHATAQGFVTTTATAAATASSAPADSTATPAAPAEAAPADSTAAPAPAEPVPAEPNAGALSADVQTGDAAPAAQ